MHEIVHCSDIDITFLYLPILELVNKKRSAYREDLLKKHEPSSINNGDMIWRFIGKVFLRLENKAEKKKE